MHDDGPFESPARMARLAAFHERIDLFCAREAMPHAMALRLQLLFEELFTNTVTHGHGGDCDVPVRLSLRRLADAVEMQYEDGAPPFDPVAAGRQGVKQREQRLRDRKVGGVGLSLLLELCSAASYVRRDGRNLVCVCIPIGS